MTPEQFTYWLDGFAQGCDKRPTKEQWESIISKLGVSLKKGSSLPTTTWTPYAGGSGTIQLTRGTAVGDTNNLP